jgi:PIN domain nuclease of toxin-antitoxin system
VILLDTHVVVWLAFHQDQLSKKARQAIDDTRKSKDGLAISDITLLELATLVNRGRLHLDITLESFLQEVESHFVVLPIYSGACARITSLPAVYPKDPVDRIIAATAMVQGIPLVTADREIRRSKALRTIW